MKMYIRWMGAFGRNRKYSFMESLEFEWYRTDEAACEIVRPYGKTKKVYSCVAYQTGARVGLLLDDACIFREFKVDCWSHYENGGSTGKLLYGHVGHGHTEAWAHMPHAVKGIVVYGSMRQLSRYALDAVKAFQRRHNLPIYVLNNGQIDKIG